jgi:hypothetical protein
MFRLELFNRVARLMAITGSSTPFCPSKVLVEFVNEKSD